MAKRSAPIAHAWTLPDREQTLSFDQPRIMAVLNVTPDSFSDGDQYRTVDHAVAAGIALAGQGAQIIDVGGESTRPGASRVSIDEQQRRVLPVIRQLRQALDDLEHVEVPISIDTTRSAVAEAALEAGASILNDVSAGREDDAMFPLAAERGCPLILMHMLGEPGTMQKAPRYDDVVGEVFGFLRDRAEAAASAGLAPSQLAVDPGIGFGKTLEHNLALLQATPELVQGGWPVLLGVSRKRWIQGIDPSAETPDAREAGGLAITTLSVGWGVAMVRVHAPALHRQAIQATRAIL